MYTTEAVEKVKEALTEAQKTQLLPQNVFEVTFESLLRVVIFVCLFLNLKLFGKFI